MVEEDGAMTFATRAQPHVQCIANPTIIGCAENIGVNAATNRGEKHP